MSTLQGPELQILLANILQTENSGDGAGLLGQHKQHDQVNFGSVDWKKLRNGTKDGRLVFPRLNWGSRTLVFPDCNFGDGDFIFPGEFGGAVAFHNVQFGEGLVSFARSSFQQLDLQGGFFSGSGSLDFSGCSFSGSTKLWIERLGEKTLDFGGYDGDFPNRGVSPCSIGGSLFLLDIKESEGHVINFNDARFLATRVAIDFHGASKLTGVGFKNTVWKSQSVVINDLNMNGEKDQRLAFTNADFEAVRTLSMFRIGMKLGRISFDLAKFPNKAIFQLHFGHVGPGTVAFNHSMFPGSVEISQERGSSFLSELSFKGSTFEGPLSLANTKFGPVPDLVGTEFHKHLNLSNIEFGQGLEKELIRAEPDRGLKLQRIKELAEGNRDHQLALMCHAEEMKHNRWRRKGFFPWAADSLDWVYQYASDYGRSIFLPIFWLFVFWLVFAGLYKWLAADLGNPLLFSAGWHLPFLPVSGVVRTVEFAEVLKSAGPPLYFWIGLQSLIAIPLLFLVGLGFRNRFRI